MTKCYLKKIVEHRKTDSSMTEHVNDSDLNSENTVQNQLISGDGKMSVAQKATKNKNQPSEIGIKFMKYMDSTE